MYYKVKEKNGFSFSKGIIDLVGGNTPQFGGSEILLGADFFIGRQEPEEE